MNDTSPAFERLLAERYAAIGGTARALMALQMFESAQRIVLASLPQGLSEAERRRELCRRFYGEEFTRSMFDRFADRVPSPAHGQDLQT